MTITTASGLSSTAKNYSQTEAGKRYFIRMYEKAVANNDKRMIDFCKRVFDVYNEFEINGHIARPNGRC